MFNLLLRSCLRKPELCPRGAVGPAPPPCLRLAPLPCPPQALQETLSLDFLFRVAAALRYAGEAETELYCW